MAKEKENIHENQMLSEKGLDALHVFEDNDDTGKVIKVKNTRLSTDKKTVYDSTAAYGITNLAIKAVKNLGKKYNIPQEVMDINDVNDLNEKPSLAREVARYYSFYNYNRINDKTNGALDEKWTQHEIDAMLTYFHNVDVSKMSKGKPGSTLDAIESGDIRKLQKSLLQKSDGTVTPKSDYIDNKKVGLLNRKIGTIQYLEDENAEVVQSVESRDKKYKDYQKDDVDIVDKTVYCLDNLDNLENGIRTDLFKCSATENKPAVPIEKTKTFEESAEDEEKLKQIEADYNQRQADEEELRKFYEEHNTDLLTRGIKKFIDFAKSWKDKRTAKQSKEIDINPSNSLNNVEGKINGN